MRIVCIGGGPAGLTFALLMKKLDPGHDITVVERNHPYDTFGWGVVFSDATMAHLRRWDEETAGAIEAAFAHWDDIVLEFKGRSIRSGGHGFVGIGRKRLLNILQARCESLGVRLEFDREVRSDTEFPGADLIVASDGINSVLRHKYAEVFKPDIVQRPNRFIWLGTKKLYDAFTFVFERTGHGWFQAHVYRFDAQTSTFIVECPEHVWLAHGLDKLDADESVAFCERVFARHLDGAKLMTNARHLRGSAWLNFQRIKCAQWWIPGDRREAGAGHAPLVLMGDAVHTAHFAIGSGTKLALEDAIELANQFRQEMSAPAAGLPSAAPQGGARPCSGAAERGGRESAPAAGLPSAAPQGGTRPCSGAAERGGRESAPAAGLPSAAPQEDTRPSSGVATRIGSEEVDASALPALLDRYQALRAVEVLRLQNAAWNAMEWFEVCGARYCDPLEPEQFMYSLLTRSQRISHENLRLRDAGWLEGYERWFAQRGRGELRVREPVPPMFTPFTVRSITLKNRVVVSPMAQYSAVDGTVGDYHLVHLGARAMGGAALVMAEMTCTSADGRITRGCPGLYTDAQGDAWARIVDWVHTHTDAHIGMQLGHAGAKGATHLGWEGIDQPLDSGGWPLMSASAQQYLPGVSDWSRAMTRADMDRVLHDFVACTRRAAAAGFDWLELHCAHGYLLSSFISPLTNHREDAYGGTLANRLRYPLEVFAAVRAAWPAQLPMSVRISSHDWVEGGITPADAVEIARAFKEAGTDLIDCSSGQVSKQEKPIYGRMFQTPFADRIRNEAGIATIAVGAISEADHVNSIIAAGRADLCAVARPHLANPAWTLTEAARIGYRNVSWPPPYRAAKPQLEAIFQRQHAQGQA